MERGFHITRRRARAGERGYTLIEMALASAISFVAISATVSFYIPTLNVFEAVGASNSTRLQVASTLNALQNDATNVLAVYVDPTQCYAVCMVDGNSNRIYYWWDPKATGTTKNLYRKMESTTNPVSCTGGSVVALGLDTTQSSFAMNKSLLNVTLSAYNPQTKSNYAVTTGIFPTAQETTTMFYEGFECASLKQGWVVNAGVGSTWSITTGSHMGDYEITDSDAVVGTTTTTLQTPINLARVPTAELTFYYMNSGTLSAGDSFTASFYDGTTWHNLFSDTSATSLSSMRVVNASLAGYAFNASNQIMFSGTLKNSGAHWYVDAISVYQP